MSIFKNCQINNFAMIPNELLDNVNLTWKAKGILCYLLRLPCDWKVHTSEIAKHSKDGIDSLNTSINELIKAGYIVRDKLRSTKGRFEGYEYSVFNTPTVTGISKNGETKNGETKNGKSKTTNTDSTNTDSTNTDSTKTTTTEIKKIIPLKEIKVTKKVKGYDAIIKEFSYTDLLKETIFEFIKMRKANNRVMTDHALNLMLINLNKLADNENDKIRILNQSIENSWKVILPLKENKSKKPNEFYDFNKMNQDTSVFNNFPHHEYDFDNLEKKLLGES